MDLLVALFLLIGAFAVGIAGNMIASELYDCAPRIALWLIHFAVSRLPEHGRPRYLEEWTRDLEDYPGKLGKVRHAIGCVWGARSLARTLVDRASGQSIPLESPDITLSIAAEANVPLNGGVNSRFVIFRDSKGSSSIAVIVGSPDVSKPIAVRLHSACLTGDVFGSRCCDCGDQLRSALTQLEAMGGGIILYMEEDLLGKIRAFKLQDESSDVNVASGVNNQTPTYAKAAQMLKTLGHERVVLLTNNPAKLEKLANAGVDIAGRIPFDLP